MEKKKKELGSVEMSMRAIRMMVRTLEMLDVEDAENVISFVANAHVKRVKKETKFTPVEETK